MSRNPRLEYYTHTYRGMPDKCITEGFQKQMRQPQVSSQYSYDDDQSANNAHAVAKLYTEDEKKTRLNNLEKFLKTYNYYISKILWSKADPFL